MIYQRVLHLLKTHSLQRLSNIRGYNINAQVTVAYCNYIYVTKCSPTGENVFSGEQDQGGCVHERDGAETRTKLQRQPRGGGDPQSEPRPLGRRQHREGHQRGDGHQGVLGWRHEVCTTMKRHDRKIQNSSNGLICILKLI